MRASRKIFSALTLLSIAACGEDPVAGLDASLPGADATSNDAAPGDDVQIFADAETPGMVRISATSLDFGLVIFGSTATRELTLQNTGGQTVRVTLAEPSGRDADKFSRVIPGADPDGAFDVAPGAIVAVEVTVTPDAEGPLAAAIAGDLCGGGCPVAITLIAEGAATGIVCDERVDFGVVNPSNCVTQEAVCSNEGNLTETIEGISLAPNSDGVFVPTFAQLPVQLAGGSTFAITLEFCPSAGTFSGTLLVNSSNPNQTQHSIELAGRGGGGDIACSPAMLDFGTLAVNGTATRVLRCENRGPEDLMINMIATTSPNFSVAQPSAVIAPGNSVDINVVASGTALGTISGELTVSSNDPDTMILSVPMTGEVIDLAPCVATLQPPALDFGLVPLGEARSASFVITNSGSNDCLLQQATISGSPEITTNAAGGNRIAPGATQTIRVDYAAPTAARTSSATLSITFANPNTPALNGLVRATSGATRIDVEPASIDFGTAPSGCAAPFTRTVTIRSLVNQPTTINNITISSTAAFSLSGAPNVPAVLAAFQTVTLTVQFAPPSTGAFASDLRIAVAGQAAPTIVPISGAGSTGVARTDVTQIPATPLDLLIVTDDSASMAAAQAAFAAAITELGSALLASGVDFHAGVVTTDMIDPDRSGRLLGMPVFMDNMTANFEDELAARVAPGTGGDGAAEQGISAAVAAVTAPLSTTDNAGFLRPNATLAVVILSDEDDQGQLADIASVVRTLRSASGNGRVSVSAIVGPATGPSCNGPNGAAAASPRYRELVARADTGVAVSFCDPMSLNISRIIGALLGGASIALSNEPLVSTITVSDDGVNVPEIGATGDRNWAYDRGTNSIVFSADALPGAGSTVTIAYDQFCLSASCGDGTPDTFEQCDDMNGSNDDSCVDGCVFARCGDGFTLSGMEACDDGNLDNGDACLLGCIAASWGDGFLQVGVEECDDGNAIGGDGCPATCRIQRDLVGWYTIANAVNAYVPLTMGTPLDFGGDNDDGIATLTMPFTFQLFDVATSTFAVSPNGLIAALGLSTPNSFTNLSFPDDTLPDGTIAAWWDDFLIDTGVAGGASVSYQVLGMPPNRSLVVQWRGVRLANHSTANNRRFNFQIALFETTNVIEYRYGETQTSGNPPTATSASVGIENQDASVGQSLLACTPSCAGPPRPQNPNGFPRQSRITLTPQ